MKRKEKEKKESNHTLGQMVQEEGSSVLMLYVPPSQSRQYVPPVSFPNVPLGHVLHVLLVGDVK